MAKVNSFAWLQPSVLVFIAPFVLLAPVWLTGQALYWGTPSTQFVPWWWQAWLSLRGGELPLWNPLVGMGAPLIANYQSAVFYPPNWTYLLLATIGGLPLMAWGEAILVALHLAFAGWGMLRLLKKLGLSELAQTIGALAFSLSGYLVARAHFLSINSAVAWLPWVLLAGYELAKEERSWRPTLKLAFFLGLQWLAGHAQISWYSLLLTLAWTAFWSRQRHGNLVRLLGRLAAAGAIALALSAIQLLPTAEYLLNSQRAAQYDSVTAMAYSFWPWRFIGLLAPNFFGNPAYGNFWGYGNFWEDAVYIGLLPFLLAIGTWFGGQGKHKSLVRFLWATVLVSFILALGDHLPIFPFLFDHVPTFDAFQAPTRFTLWAVFALSILAAIAADNWRAPQRGAMYWARLAAAGSVAVIAVSTVAIFLTERLAIPQTFVRATLGMGILALFACLLYIRTPAKPKRNANWAWAVTIFVMLDLLWAGWGLNPGGPLNLYSQHGQPVARAEQLRGERLYLSTQDEQLLKFNQLFRFDDFYSANPRTIHDSLLPNISSLDGIRSANNFDPLLPRRYSDWIGTLDQASPEVREQMLAAMSVGVVAMLRDEENAALLFTQAETLDRVRFVGCARNSSDSDDAFDQVRRGVDFAQVVIAETDADLQAASCGGALGSAIILSETSNSLTVQVDALDAGWLVLADTWFPGWQALVNGRRATIYPAYGVFRAVQVPQGQAIVEFQYRPASFSLGLLASSLAWPVLAVLWSKKRNA